MKTFSTNYFSIHTIHFYVDARYNTFGSSALTFYPTVDATASLLTATDIAILSQATIAVAGRIASIQFYTSGSGSITIYVSDGHN
jgi:hypothetical protein